MLALEKDRVWDEQWTLGYNDNHDNGNNNDNDDSGVWKRQGVGWTCGER